MSFRRTTKRLRRSQRFCRLGVLHAEATHADNLHMDVTQMILMEKRWDRAALDAAAAEAKRAASESVDFNVEQFAQPREDGDDEDDARAAERERERERERELATVSRKPQQPLRSKL